MRTTTQAAVGADTVAALSRLRADTVFLGTNALSRDHGLSTPDADEAATKRAMVASARRVVVLADSTKLGRESAISFAALDEVDCLVTDAGISPDRPRRARGRSASRSWSPRDRRRIVTLTPNPSIDRTVTLGSPLQRGAVHRLESVTSQAGGKGVNISRACVSAGVDTTAVLPADRDDPFVHELVAGRDPAPPRAQRPPRAGQPDRHRARRHHDQAQQPRPPASGSVLRGLAATLHDLAAESDWIVLAGSLPPGAPVGWYADLVADLRPLTRVAVDTSDAPLRALVERLDVAPPHVMKPNGEELASFTGGDAAELEADPVAAAAAARHLVDRGVEAVLATLGPHGAVLVTAGGAWHAAPPPTDVVSTVGAGDSSLFGYLLGALRGQDPAERLALAVAYGSAAAGLPGTTIPAPAQVHADLVRVRALPHLVRVPDARPDAGHE